MLSEVDLEHRSSGEVDALIESPDACEQESCYDDAAADDIEYLSVLDELDLSLDLQRRSSVLLDAEERWFSEPLALRDDVEVKLRYDNSCEYTYDDTEHQCEREALDRAGTYLIEDDCSDQSRYLRVDYRTERSLEALLRSGPDALAADYLFPDPREYDYVRVDRHTYGEDDAGDARKVEYASEEGHYQQHYENVHSKREVSDQTDQPVSQKHDEEYESKTYQARDYTLLKSVESDRSRLYG